MMKMAAVTRAALATLALGSTMAFADIDISFGVNSAYGLWMNDPGMDFNDSDAMPAGLFYQIWWSSDPVQAGDTTGIIEDSAQLTQSDVLVSDHGYNDYVIGSGTTSDIGGFYYASGGPFRRGDGDVDNAGTVVPAHIRDGYVYVYVYENAAPVAGDQYFYTSIFDTTSFANPDNIPVPDPPTDVSFGDSPLVLNVNTRTVQPVPEPTTMGLLAIGALTVAASRRRKHA